MRIRNRLTSLLLALVLAFGVCASAVAATDPATPKVLIWSINAQQMVLDIVPAIFDAYQKSGVTVVDQTENTEHFAKGTDLAKNYGLVILYFPAEELNETDIAVLQAYVDAGGRILMHGENPSAVPDENIALSNAAKALGTSFTITDIADAEYDATINTASDLITNPGHEVTEVHPD